MNLKTQTTSPHVPRKSFRNLKQNIVHISFWFPDESECSVSKSCNLETPRPESFDSQMLYCYDDEMPLNKLQSDLRRDCAIVIEYE